MSSSSKRQVDQDHPSLEGVRVLVVEDTWHVAKALKSALEQFGMDISGPAATTAEARRLMVEQMPLVAVVDVNLKGEMAGGLIEAEHRARYWWASAAVRGREVLDAGCGEGYGLVTLAAAGASRLIGVDLSEEAVHRARSRTAG